MTTHQLKRRPKRNVPSIAQKKREVTTFFERDYNSRLKADKNATITQQGCKKQIRLLNDDIRHLHAKYKQYKISLRAYQHCMAFTLKYKVKRYESVSM